VVFNYYPNPVCCGNTTHIRKPSPKLPRMLGNPKKQTAKQLKAAKLQEEAARLLLPDAPAAPPAAPPAAVPAPKHSDGKCPFGSFGDALKVANTLRD
jgi:hypothetical protein